MPRLLSQTFENGWIWWAFVTGEFQQLIFSDSRSSLTSQMEAKDLASFHNVASDTSSVTPGNGNEDVTVSKENGCES